MFKTDKCVCCLVFGIILMSVGVLADYIGIGTSGVSIKQAIVIVAGIVLIIIGSKPCKMGSCCKKNKEE